MPPRKLAVRDRSTPALEASVARLEERVDNFHDHTFPTFCQGIKDDLLSMQAKLDRAVIRNGEFDKVKTMAEEWERSSLRREGAITVLRFSWRVFAWTAGFAATTGLLGGGFFWLLGRLTGHI